MKFTIIRVKRGRYVVKGPGRTRSGFRTLAEANKLRLLMRDHVCITYPQEAQREVEP